MTIIWFLGHKASFKITDSSLGIASALNSIEAKVKFHNSNIFLSAVGSLFFCLFESQVIFSLC